MIVRSTLAGLLTTTILGLVTANVGCSLIVERDLKSGVGAACKSNDDCQGQGATCLPEGICSKSCSVDTDCPTGSVCSVASGSCFEPLKIGAIYIGNSGEGWTKTHADGLKEVAANLGFPQVDAVDGVLPQSPDLKGAKKVVQDFIDSGHKVIVATSTSYNADITPIAAANPDVKFLVCEGTSVTENLGSYYGRREQAWYLAGQVAARASTTGKLGVVGSFVSPDNVRNINAFLLGARKLNPSATVEVRWSGFWFDYIGPVNFDDDADGTGFCTEARKCSLEEYLTDKLIAGGADVVTHQSDVDLSINFVEAYNRAKPTPEAATVRSIANNNRFGCRATGSPTGSVLPSCLAAVYWNWTPLYTTLFTEMRLGVWKPKDIYESIKSSAERESSTVGLEQSELGTSVLSQFEMNNRIDEVAGKSDPYWIFAGDPTNPYLANDRPPVSGPLTTEEALTMCWFAKGVVEHRDEPCVQNPKGCTPVDAIVPRAGRIPWKAVVPFGETTTAFDCVAHGGK